MEKHLMKSKLNGRLQEKEPTVEEVAQVKKLFDDKGWSVESDEFGNFCKMIANLESESQKSLILNLSKQFCWVTANDYYGLFEKAFSKMLLNKVPDAVIKLKIILIPLMVADDVNDIKSGQFLFYAVKSNLSKLQRKYKEKCDITYAESIATAVGKNSESDLCTNPDVFVCPVDDYMGTGGTTLECVRNLESWGLPREKVIFLFLAAQMQGLEKCAAESVKAFSSIQMGRQISDFPNADENLKIMNEIETSIKIKKKYRLGYGHSEALIKLERTPNNTFPVYWYTHSDKRTVPFPR